MGRVRKFKALGHLTPDSRMRPRPLILTPAVVHDLTRDGRASALGFGGAAVQVEHLLPLVAPTDRTPFALASTRPDHPLRSVTHIKTTGERPEPFTPSGRSCSRLAG
jgi:hypothetical protein